MAKPMATDKELNRLRKKGMEVTPESLREVRAELRAEAMAKADAANRKGMAAGKAVTEPAGADTKKKPQGKRMSAAERAVTEPAGYAKGGMVKKKGKMYANCGASVPASKKR